MIITAIGVQARNKDRVNVSVDGKYRFSLDMFQVIELGIKVGKSYDEAELTTLEEESQFGKLYGRALEYCLMRPHSAREVCVEEGMQYVVTMNSDDLSKAERVGHSFEEYVIEPRLTDAYDDGGLFGFRFE
jgi:regulatory protein